MREIKNEKDLEEVMKRIITRVFPSTFRGPLNNVRSGYVKSVYLNTNTVDVLVAGTGQILNNIRYHSGAENVNIGDFCLLISPDPKLTTQIKAVIFGNSPLNSTPEWWEELGRDTIKLAADALTLSDLPERKYLKLFISIIPDGNVRVQIRFNNDTGSNYANRASTNGGEDAANTSQTLLQLNGSGVITTPSFSVVEIVNIAGFEKLFIAESVDQSTAGAGTAPTRRESVGKWINTSEAITRIDILHSESGDFAPGSEVIVLGHD